MQKFCALSQAVGNDEECPRAWCAFWEHGGAVVEPGCAIERIGLDLGNRDLAYYLLELRRTLEAAGSETEVVAAHRQLAELIPSDLAES
jgi:hypothetical protein